MAEWHLEMMLIYVRLVLTAALWGGTFVAGRVLALQLSPASAAFLRFLVASFALLLLATRTERRVPRLSRREIGPVLVLGATGVLAYNIFFFKGLSLIPAGRAALIIANNPVAITLASVVVFSERLRPRQWLGVLISLAGAVLVISRGDPATLTAGGFGWGEVCILGAVASWVTYSLVGKVALRTLSPVVSVFYASLFGTLGLMPFALAEGVVGNLGDVSVLGWLSILYLGLLGTVVGFVWFYQGVQVLGPAKAGLFINFVPVFAVIFSWLLLEEAVGVSVLAGAGLVISGVILTNRQ